MHRTLALLILLAIVATATGYMSEVKSSLKNGSAEFAALNGRLAACEAELAVIKAQADARSKARYWWLAAALSLWSTFVAAFLAFVAKWFTTSTPPPPTDRDLPPSQTCLPSATAQVPDRSLHDSGSGYSAALHDNRMSETSGRHLVQILIHGYLRLRQATYFALS